jgi:hypothetical protein
MLCPSQNGGMLAILVGLEEFKTAIAKEKD